ncbi:hypothetical protein PROFUN_13795 [Planoprotostelium fungivorum]|uniref:Helicase-associated domain-containing protein n=1 Tax=Planoprotostelium fungivorum TaxID=1890364 RepID=A0A2P6N370_9EUKA|nr:hypothetical protein PROFUN_13795 [Planoprotostelium fungivorum]
MRIASGSFFRDIRNGITPIKHNESLRMQVFLDIDHTSGLVLRACWVGKHNEYTREEAGTVTTKTHTHVEMDEPQKNQEGEDSSLKHLIKSFLFFPDELQSTHRHFPALTQCGSIRLDSSLPPPFRSTNPMEDTKRPEQQPKEQQWPTPSKEQPPVLHRAPFHEMQRAGSIAETNTPPSHTSDEEEEDNGNAINGVWMRHYEELRRFKSLHHHTNVTRTKKDTRKLGNWVAEQRRKKKQGRLNQQQIDFLTAAGFEWEKRRKRSSREEPASPPSDFASTASSALMSLSQSGRW